MSPRGAAPSSFLHCARDQWNVVAVAYASGVVQERYGYDAFGTTLYMDPWFGTIASSAYSWETTFCGYWLDITTGFYQVRHRYLHPGLGRWLSRDPIAERGGLNLYKYVLGNPVNILDSSGLAWWEWIPGISTGTHLIQRLRRTIPGLKVEDYASCANTDDSDESIQKCNECIQTELGNYIAAYIGVSTGADAMKVLAGGATGLIGVWATREGVAMASTATGVGAIIAADAIADVGIVIDTVFKMQDSAKQAMKKYCCTHNTQ